MDKKNDNGSSGVIGETVAEEDLKALMKIIAGQAAQTLCVFYPEVAKVNPKRIEDAARGAAMDYAQYVPIRELVAARKATSLRIELLRASLLGPEPTMVLAVAAPAHMDKCETPQQIFTLLTILALLYDDTLRAMLYFNGYRLNWKVMQDAPTPRLVTPS